MEVIHVRMDKIIDQRVRQYANTFGIENWLIDKRLKEIAVQLLVKVASFDKRLINDWRIVQ